MEGGLGQIANIAVVYGVGVVAIFIGAARNSITGFTCLLSMYLSTSVINAIDGYILKKSHECYYT